MRVIEPHMLEYRWSDWYLDGYCRHREEARMFKLTRLWKLKAMDEEPFPKRDLPQSREDADIWQEVHRVRLRVERSQIYMLVEQYGPDCFTDVDENWVEIEQTFTHWNYMLRWILSFGGSAQVLNPPHLRQAILEHARAMARDP